MAESVALQTQGRELLCKLLPRLGPDDDVAIVYTVVAKDLEQGAAQLLKVPVAKTSC